jgi:hypothetical protein
MWHGRQDRTSSDKPLVLQMLGIMTFTVCNLGNFSPVECYRFFHLVPHFVSSSLHTIDFVFVSCHFNVLTAT